MRLQCLALGVPQESALTRPLNNGPEPASPDEEEVPRADAPMPQAPASPSPEPQAEAIAEAKEAAAKAAAVKEEMIDDFIARVDREASPSLAGRASVLESSADEEITGACSRPGQPRRANGSGKGTWTCPSCDSFVSRGPSAFCARVQITWHRSLRWFSSHRPRSWLRQRLRSPPRQGGRTVRLPEKDGAWRLQNPNQQRMLVKIKNLDLSSVPYLSERSRVLLLTGVETSYEPVAEASTVTAKPPSPVSSAAQAKASVAKPPKKAPAAAFLVPTPKAAPPTANLLDVWVLRQEGSSYSGPCSSYFSCQEPPCGGLSRVAPMMSRSSFPAEPAQEARSRGSEQPKTSPNQGLSPTAQAAV